MSSIRQWTVAVASLISMQAIAQDGSGLRADLEPAFGLRAGFDVQGARSLADRYSNAGQGSIESGLVLADWHPLSSGFRLTGGLAYNNPRIEAFGVAARSAWTPALDVAVADSGTLRSPLARTRPYLGLGWGVAPSARSGLYFSADVGLLYQRGASASCSTALPPMLCAQLQNDLKLDDDLRLAPVMTMGVGLRF